MTFDLVIAGTQLGEIGIADGVIAEIAPELAGGRNRIEARRLLVLPGAIDAHVHLDDPGRADWEGFESGTLALAAGGTTCLIDMPLNSSPPTVDGASFDAKVAAARGRAAIDFALWGGIVPGDVDRLDELAERGVVGFKAFMCPSGIDDFAMADELTLARAMERAARLDLPVAVHAEDAQLVAALTEQARAAGRRDVRAFLDSRPIEAECRAIASALELARAAGCALHVVHVSSARGVRLCAEARAAGLDVTCETCPHYLLLCDEDVERLGAIAKCAPPLRSASDRDELWAELRAGRIALVASDHSPAPPELKRRDDFFDVWGGIDGGQQLLGSLLGELPPEQISQLVSRSVAERFRLPGKGSIEVGMDADVVLVELAPTRVELAELRSRHRQSPYVGRSFGGRAVDVLVRGRRVLEPGVRPGGRLVRPVRGV